MQAACSNHWDGFEETEYGAYNWSQPPLDASRVVSLRPPLERLLSSYLFEGGIKQCWAFHDVDGDIDLTGDEPNPAWDAKNWSFVQRCFANHLRVTPFDEFIRKHPQNANTPFVEHGWQKYYGSNYYLQKLQAARRSRCGPVDVPPQNWKCHVQEARHALLSSFDVVTLFYHGGMYALRAAKPAQHVPCCLDSVPWLHLRKYSAEGSIHPVGWMDARIADLTKTLEKQIPTVYPTLWRQLREANAADQSLFDEMVSYATRAEDCPS